MKLKQYFSIQDLRAGIVVFFIALPLCLGIAFASGAPLISGIISGIIGGIVVGFISGSHTSVSGPAAGLTAVVAAQIATLGSFESFLAALIIAGFIQITMGLMRVGVIATFFPSSVIKGLLAAIGIILVLKQIPHLIGFDQDAYGEMLFHQPDHENTFSEIFKAIQSLHLGALLVGFLSLAFLVLWDKIPFLKKSPIPSFFVVVALGIISTIFLQGSLSIGATHRVQVPLLENFFTKPDWASFLNFAIYKAGLTLALVASLETLLNLEAVDKIDPVQRISPKNRELIAQGIGNLSLGIIGGIPVTSVVVRSSVNINAGSKTKASAIIHGFCLLFAVIAIPTWINYIPVSCLAAILILTGIKLASPKLVKQMWNNGHDQFLPFVFTIVAIVFTDLLTGVGIGLFTSIIFILRSNLQRPLDIVEEKLPSGTIFRFVLANQVSFLNRASLTMALEKMPKGSQVVLDGSATRYIDLDMVDLIQDFKEQSAPARNITVSLLGFKPNYQLENEINYIDHATFDLQKRLNPPQILQILKDGNERVLKGRRIHRDINRQISATAEGQFPLAVVLSCMDSRTPVELIFDLGIGDIFSIRMAGNVVSEKVLGSLEFACVTAGAKLIIVMGHTRCGAVKAALDTKGEFNSPHLNSVINDIQKLLNEKDKIPLNGTKARADFEEQVIHKNVINSLNGIYFQNQVLKNLINIGSIHMIGCIYDVRTGRANFIDNPLQEFRIRQDLLNGFLQP